MSEDRVGHKLTTYDDIVASKLLSQNRTFLRQLPLPQSKLQITRARLSLFPSINLCLLDLWYNEL